MLFLMMHESLMQLEWPLVAGHKPASKAPVLGAQCQDASMMAAATFQPQ